MTSLPSNDRILVLTDGSPAAETAVRLATEIAHALSASLTILGVSSDPSDDAAIAAAVSAAQAHARPRVPSLETVQATGDLFDVAARRTAESAPTLVVLGATRHTDHAGVRLPKRLWRIAKGLEPPVLAAVGPRTSIRKILFCSGGERYIEPGAELVARMAAALGAQVTVFHVVPHAPAMYGENFGREETDPEEFLRSNSRLARNLRRQVAIFRDAGVPVTFATGGGGVLPATLEKIRRTDADLVVTGSSPARGALGTYMLGNLTRDIITHANRPFLILRSRLPRFFEEIWRIVTEPSEESRRRAAGAISTPPPPEPLKK
jgi:nucleotide-binding universal stress UspA family protein